MPTSVSAARRTKTVVFETVPAEPTTIEFPWPANPFVFPAETSNPAGGATVMPVAKFEPDRVKLVGEADGAPNVVLTSASEPETESEGEGAALVDSTVPEITKSLAVVPRRSKTYQVPPLAPLVLTMRSVSVVPLGMFCSAAIPSRGIGPAAPPPDVDTGKLTLVIATKFVPLVEYCSAPDAGPVPDLR